MRPTDPERHPPRVTAVLVVCNGEEWLPAALAAVARQTYEHLDLVAVDNASSDGSPQILARSLSSEALISLRRNRGFTRGVAAALHHPAVAGADHLLLLHDDLVLADDAVERLVEALAGDPQRAIVGPKLRRWDAEDRLQSVGLTIDRYGRAETLLEPREYDQGQHDDRGETLYVPTAGMLMRRAVLDTLPFDLRFPAFRDDLDLCWRAWVAGHRVAVVPSAVGYHAQAGERPERAIGGRNPWQARYFAERHGVAAVLKNSGVARLALAVPVMLLGAVARTAGLALTRRFGAAAAVVRAYLWNVRQLPATLRARRAVRGGRVRRDRELAHLFAPGLPRLRSTVWAAGDWLAGGRPDRGPSGEAPVPGRRGIVTLVGLAVLVIYVVGAFPLLGPGQLAGGQIAPWPGSPRAFLDALTAPWGVGPAASGVLASPAQALLWLASLLGFGSSWAAQRLVVLGLLPVAWLLALRAGRLLTERPGPRVLGATLYVLFPATWGALAGGHLGALVAAALLPGIAVAGVRAADPRTAPGSGWRAAALLMLGTATMLAFAPSLWPLPAGVWSALLVGALLGRSWQPVVRTAAAGAGCLALLAPWLVERLNAGWSLPAAGPVAGATGADGLPLWRALTAAPPVVAGVEGVAGWLLAGLAGGLLVSGVVLGMRTRPMTVALLVAVVAASGLAGWGTALAAPEHPWPVALLLPAALGLAGLGVVAARDLLAGLRAYDFGAVHLAVGVAIAGVVAGAGAGVAQLAGGPWTGLERVEETLPAFVTADVPRVGPYRVLVLAGDDSQVGWELLGAEGPTMTAFGATASPVLLDAVQDAVIAASGGVDPRGGATLGVLNVRYVVVPDPVESDDLLGALAQQPALEPVPSGDVRVYRVESWLPRATALDAERAGALRNTGDPGPMRELEESGLARTGRNRYAGPAAGGRLLVLAEAPSPRWRVEADGVPAERVDLGPVEAFTLPPGAGRVTVEADPPPARLWLSWVALAALALVVLLTVRPPGLTEAQVRRAAAADLPSDLRPDAPSSREVAS